MTQTKPSIENVLSRKILRYSYAAGAGVLVSPLILADGIDFDPPGGLPIVIDTNVTSVDPVLIDVESDGIDDLEVFYETTYGGGFVIRSLDQDVAIQSQTDGGFNTNTRRATRNDPTEYVSVDPLADVGFLYGDYISFFRLFVDTDGIPAETPPYTPFRDNPGFLGLALRTPGSNGGYASTLEVVVNSDGTEMTILGGSYRQDGLDLYLGDDDLIIKEGFESASRRTTESSFSLQSLAFGKGD